MVAFTQNPYFNIITLAPFALYIYKDSPIVLLWFIFMTFSNGSLSHIAEVSLLIHTNDSFRATLTWRLRLKNNNTYPLGTGVMTMAPLYCANLTDAFSQGSGLISTWDKMVVEEDGHNNVCLGCIMKGTRYGSIPRSEATTHGRERYS